MRVDGLPNKFEIYQEYYYELNGVKITYAEALKLYSQMEAEEKTDFENYYKDEVGYEIISPSGYNLKNNSKQTNSAYINIKYTIEAYAAENGIVLDPIWSQYSAEEIIQMEDGGVDIPQEILDIAHTIYDSQAAADVSEDDETDETTEKDTFLNLIPKTQKKLEKCEENNEKIDDEISKLLPEKSRQERQLQDKLEDQQKSLKEYEEFIREWRKLQNKVNNGEALSNREAKRYAELTGYLNDSKSKDNGFEIDKREIARSLNEINILAFLGEKLATETIEYADTLADYTSKTNYKATFRETMGQVGPFAVFATMILGKNLAYEAGKIGNDTKEYTEETQQSVMDIAQIMEIEGSIANPQSIETPEVETTIDEEATIQETESEGVTDQENTENPDNVEANPEVKDEINNPETTPEEDFIIDDDSVMGLTKEAVKIDTDLAKQTVDAVKATKEAKNDEKQAKSANKRITRYVKEMKNVEEEDKKEEENKEENSVQQTNGENKFKKSEKEEKVQQFVQDTQKESEMIKEAIPEQMEAQETDTEYDQEIIPQDKEQLDFTSNSGETLAKMGTYRIITGLEQIAAFQFVQGAKNIAKGTISTTIGLGAITVSETPAPKIAEKATDTAIKHEDKALNKLGEVDNQIAEVTGEETVTNQTKAQMAEENNEEGSENGKDTEAAINDANVEASVNDVKKAVTPEQSAPAQATPQVRGGANAMMVLANQREMDRIKSIRGDNKTASGATAKKPGKSQSSPENEGKDALKEGASMQKDTGKASSQAKQIGGDATNDSKESEKIKKDTEKDEKQLLKETKKLEKEMQKDQKDIEKMTKESMRAAAKQAELLTSYQALSDESEQLATEEEEKQQNSSTTTNSAQTTQAAMGIASTGSNDNSSDNIQKLQENEITINSLGNEFKLQGNIITRNQLKIKKLEKKTKVNEKKFSKKCKLRQKKLKETQKKEQEKQKRLAKQLGAVGIIENLFSLVSATGTIYCLVTAPPLLSNPFTAALGGATLTLGQLLIVIGTAGTVLCGVTKGIINIANGNLTAGLISIGQAAISAATSLTGSGGASSTVMTAVSTGLQVVSNSTELVNNVRQVQGKEANGTLSKISTLAGIGSSVTNAASGIKNAKGTFGMTTAIASATGTALSSASQIMTEFKLGNEKTANILGMIGGGLQTAASMAQIAQKFSGAKNKNNDTKQKTDQLQNNQDDKNNNSNTNTPGTDTPSTDNPDTPSTDTPNTDVPETENQKPENSEEVANLIDDTPPDVLEASGIPVPQNQQPQQETPQNDVVAELTNNASNDIEQIAGPRTVDSNRIQRLESNKPSVLDGIKLATVENAQIIDVKVPGKKLSFLQRISSFKEVGESILGMSGNLFASTDNNNNSDQNSRNRRRYTPTAEERRRLRQYQEQRARRSAYYRNTSFS